MPKFRFCATVGVSAYTFVTADTEEQALVLAEQRTVTLCPQDYAEEMHDHWVIIEADGEAQNIQRDSEMED